VLARTGATASSCQERHDVEEKVHENHAVKREYYAVAYWTTTGRSNLDLKNRLARAAKMIGVKPTTAP